MSQKGEYRVALVHDELTRRGGAELVFEELIRLYPRADIFALYAGRPAITIAGQTKPIQTTFLQRFPAWFRRHPRRLLPLLPFAAEQLDFSKYDVVISSASGFAKNIITRATIPHVCYCHTPPRYLWEDTQAALARLSPWRRFPAQLILHNLRLFDYAAAQRVDSYIANSNWTKERIKTYYGRNSTVIPPPIDTAFYTPGRLNQSNEERAPFLCVGRLTPAKRFEHAILACAKLDWPLIIVGSGYHQVALKKLAGPQTRFVGQVSRAVLRNYYRAARALLQPGEEDFGMASVEALACGTPVIAYGLGGARELIRTTECGLLYQPASVEALAEAMRRQTTVAETQLGREARQHQAMAYSTGRWQLAISHHIENIIHQAVLLNSPTVVRSKL